MDFVSAVKSDVLRPVLTYVIPGAFVVGPSLIVLGHYVPQAPVFWNDHGTAFGLIAGLVVIFVGGLLETIGTRLEVLWDRLLAQRPDAKPSNWEEYLKLRVKDDIVGQRYLRNLVTRMKFELSMVLALPLSGVGLAWTNALYNVWSCLVIALIELLLLALTSYLAWESYQSAILLERTRRLVIDAVQGSIPAATTRGESCGAEGV